MANVKLVKINKIYDGNVHAVHDFTLDIKDQEFIVLVGPSGCGKSTTLRMVAGLEEISTGDLYIDGKIVNSVAPKDREIAMVFQSYALYPQMTVAGNMAYSLKLHHVPKDEIKRRVAETAEILGLKELLDRKPKALSGGQRQRVALGRAIIRNPKVFLMDEPLSNLDAKLRVQMRSEIIRIHNEVKATTIYVTHDQVEAMTMASRIVVMNNGFIQQIGEPNEIYENPNNVFVAGFIGTPPMNFIKGVVSSDGKSLIIANEKEILLGNKLSSLLENYHDKEIIYGVRPEHLCMMDEAKAALAFKVNHIELLGDVQHCYGEFGGSKIVLKASSQANIKPGETVYVTPNEDYVCLFDADTQERIR